MLSMNLAGGEERKPRSQKKSQKDVSPDHMTGSAKQKHKHA